MAPVLPGSPTRIGRFIVWVLLEASGTALSQNRRPTRMVIDSAAVCRAEPSTAAPQGAAYKLGDVVSPAKEVRHEGAYWYFDEARAAPGSPSCWIYGPLTADFNPAQPEPALLALIDHLLERAEEARFEDFATVDNLLAGNESHSGGRLPSFAPVVKSSGLLQFRRLQIISSAALKQDVRQPIFDPVKKAWILSHQDVLYFDVFDGLWLMRPEAYWTLYATHRGEPWAEDLAWAAAQLFVPRDECYADCTLDIIDKTLLQYWTRFPHGAHIREALARATPIAKYAAEMACYAQQPGLSVSRAVLEKMRGSLSGVSAAEKRQFLEYLDQIERKCYQNKG